MQRIAMIASSVGLNTTHSVPSAAMTNPEIEIPLTCDETMAPLLQQNNRPTIEPRDNAWLWSEVASQGERQRMAFARIIYHRPAIVNAYNSSRHG